MNTNTPYANMELARLRKKYEHDLTMAQQDAASHEQAYRKILEASNKPFEETEDFRDYVVWLCGFTEHHEPPGKEDWESLRERTKHIAAKFALAARDRAREEAQRRVRQEQIDYRTYTGGLASATSSAIDTAAIDAMTTGTTTTFTTPIGANTSAKFTKC